MAVPPDTPLSAAPDLSGKILWDLFADRPLAKPENRDLDEGCAAEPFRRPIEFNH